MSTLVSTSREELLKPRHCTFVLPDYALRESLRSTRWPQLKGKLSDLATHKDRAVLIGNTPMHLIETEESPKMASRSPAHGINWSLSRHLYESGFAWNQVSAALDHSRTTRDVEIAHLQSIVDDWTPWFEQLEQRYQGREGPQNGSSCEEVWNGLRNAGNDRHLQIQKLFFTPENSGQSPFRALVRSIFNRLVVPSHVPQELLVERFSKQVWETELDTFNDTPAVCRYAKMLFQVALLHIAHRDRSHKNRENDLMDSMYAFTSSYTGSICSGDTPQKAIARHLRPDTITFDAIRDIPRLGSWRWPCQYPVD